MNLKNLIFFSNVHARNGNLYLRTKFYRNRLIHSWDMEIKLYSKWQLSAILSSREYQLWSRDLYWHMILHLRSKFRSNRPIWRRNIAINDCQYGDSPLSWICNYVIILLHQKTAFYVPTFCIKFWRRSIAYFLKYISVSAFWLEISYFGLDFDHFWSSKILNLYYAQKQSFFFIKTN